MLHVIVILFNVMSREYKQWQVMSRHSLENAILPIYTWHTSNFFYQVATYVVYYTIHGVG